MSHTEVWEANVQVGVVLTFQKYSTFDGYIEKSL